MWWAVAIALAPLICDVTITAAIGARPLSSIGLFHVGLCGFGLTLAAFVRILSHGRGVQFLPLLCVIFLLEVLLALYFGGAFSHHDVELSRIDSDLTIIERAAPNASLTAAELAQIHEDLTAVRDSEPESTMVGFLLLSGFGIFSLSVLIRYWDRPTAPERLRAEQEARGGA